MHPYTVSRRHSSPNQPPSTNTVHPKNIDADNKSTTLLTEIVHGRIRVYKHLPNSTTLIWDWIPSTGLSFFEKILPRRLAAYLRALFLPVGYPESVHPTYAKVHFWQFLETYVGSMVGVLCTEAMLTSLGVEASAAAGGAVAIEWVLKDGFGEIGKLFFIQRFAKSFDSHPKSWKIVGEASSLFGSFVQLLTVVAPASAFLPLASFGYACRSIHFSIWAATHMTFTRNFALQGNVGDLVAKDDSQMTVADLFGLVSGVGLISLPYSTTALFIMFFILGSLHYFSTLRLVWEAQFEVLNGSKLVLISDTFLRTNRVPSMKELKPRESWFGESIRLGEKVPTVVLGDAVRKAFDSVAQVQLALDLLRKENYLISRKSDGRICVVFHTDATEMDVIKAVLNSIRFQHDLSVNASREPNQMMFSSFHDRIALKSSHEWTEANFPKFVTELADKDWQSDAVFWGDSGYRVDWTRPFPESDQVVPPLPCLDVRVINTRSLV
ncbi:hypothetical protein SmJEL517_g04819 [Synchytrium microbalum]|uniref:Uncharacterized protein n=1 Tax=Synchytrium microbalum TaxID=1806994 RepID=A0A507C1Z7_9FUNG|nr:uncharacterized protein SmJEL517_g04819 [Synchytrium microbalum]TPX31976.1 hypothetical protein SmJEL517_g04819 [Synchytrium microbalum]